MTAYEMYKLLEVVYKAPVWSLDYWIARDKSIKKELVENKTSSSSKQNI